MAWAEAGTGTKAETVRTGGVRHKEKVTKTKPSGGNGTKYEDKTGIETGSESSEVLRVKVGLKSTGA